MRTPTRRAYLAAVSAAALAGCLDEGGSAASGGESTRADGPGGGAGEADSGAPPTTTRNLPLPADTGTLEESSLSGAQKDSIPSIDDPTFTDAAGGDEWLDPAEPVFGAVRDGEAKAYPQRVLVWHEVVNDVLGGDPVAVTYCPLTGTVQGFERGGTEFGVSGELINSNLVMYDRATESYWPQMLAVGITGPHEGDELVEFPVTWTTWERWRSTHPETAVLTDETGYVRNYESDPYGSYNPRKGHYADSDLMFPQFGDGSDHEFHPKDVVIGARSADGALAVVPDRLADALVLRAEVGSVPHVAVSDPPLDTGWIYRDPDGADLDHDGETVSLAGETYSPGSLPLEPVVRYDAMWFAWEGYYPETEVLQ